MFESDLCRRLAECAVGGRESFAAMTMRTQGLSLGEVARIQGLPKSTVQKRVDAGVRRLAAAGIDVRRTIRVRPPPL